MATNNNRLPVRAPPSGNQTPAAPRQPGSALLSIAQALLDKSKAAGGNAAAATKRAAEVTKNAARKTGRAALDIVPSPANLAIDEGASLGSHALAHTVHRYLGPYGVLGKGGLELLALVIAKLKKAPPKVMRGFRSSLRGTLHHSLGTGLHRKWPIPPGTGAQAVTTSGVEGEAGTGEAETEEEDASQNTRF